MGRIITSLAIYIEDILKSIDDITDHYRHGRLDRGRQPAMAAGVCPSHTGQAQGGSAEGAGHDGQVPSQVADDGRRELLPERMGRHRGHPHGRRLRLGQQPG